MRVPVKEKVKTFFLVSLLGLKSIVLQKYLNVVAAEYFYVFVEIWCILQSLTGVVFSSLTEDKFIGACKPLTVKAISRFVLGLCKYVEIWLKKT